MNASVAPLSAVIFSRDPSAVAITERVLVSSGFGITKVGGAESMRNLLRRNRFDLAVLDHDCGALDVIGDSNSGAARIVVAFIKATEIRELAGRRVHFTVQKPLLGDILVRTVRAAYSSIGRDRRLTYRFPVAIDAVSSSFSYAGETRDLQRTQIINVSHSGLCMIAPEMLPQGASVRLRVPCATGSVAQVTGTVIWAHASGRAGVELNHDSHDHNDYDLWLDSMLDSEGEIIPPLRQNDTKRIPRVGPLPPAGDVHKDVARLI